MRPVCASVPRPARVRRHDSELGGGNPGPAQLSFMLVSILSVVQCRFPCLSRQDGHNAIHPSLQHSMY